MIRTKDIAITEGDDKGKAFVVHQMPLLAGDRWANRVALALCKSGVDISGLTVTDENGKPLFRGLMDIAGIVNVALKALGGVDDQVAQELLDELMRHVKFRLQDGSSRSLNIESDISSIQTLWKLRIEAIKVNLDFLAAGVTQ